MAATVFKIFDIWLDEIAGKRVDPDGATTSLQVLPIVFHQDTIRFNFRVFEGGILEYPFKSDSELQLSIKGLQTDTIILANAINTDFVTGAWDAADAYTSIPLSAISKTFSVNNLVKGGTSLATGRVFFFDTVNKKIWLKKVTGTFAAAETITETLPDSTTNATATTGTPLIEAFSRTNGRVSCDVNLATVNLDTFMTGRASDTVFVELIEKFADATQRTIAQFNIVIVQDLFAVGDGLLKQNVVIPNAFITKLLEDLIPKLGGNLDVEDKKIISSANRNIIIEPNGTGGFKVSYPGGTPSNQTTFESLAAGIRHILSLQGFSVLTDEIASFPGGGAALFLTNKDTTNGNFNSIVHQDSDFTNLAGIVFKTDDHVANNSSMHFLTANGGVVGRGLRQTKEAFVSFDKNPALLYERFSAQSNITGDGTKAVFLWDTKRFEIGTNYATGTGRFTSPNPTSSLFFVFANIRLTGLAAAALSDAEFFFDNNGPNSASAEVEFVSLADTKTSGNILMVNIAGYVELDNGDFVEVAIRVDGDVSKNVDLAAGSMFGINYIGATGG